jgi:hypothetical protein
VASSYHPFVCWRHPLSAGSWCGPCGPPTEPDSLRENGGVPHSVRLRIDRLWETMKCNSTSDLDGSLSQSELPRTLSGTFECAICWGDIPGLPTALPCCGAPPAGSTTCYCKRCLEVICETALGGMGRCPTCREFIQVVDGELAVAEGLETCCVCNQARPVAETLRDGRPLCTACALGIRNPLRYECERCHRVGPVPHPMYRYQVSPATFGNNTWFCQVSEIPRSPARQRLPNAHPSSLAADLR